MCRNFRVGLINRLVGAQHIAREHLFVCITGGSYSLLLSKNVVVYLCDSKAPLMANVQPVSVILPYFLSPLATGLKNRGFRWLVFMKFNRFFNGIERILMSHRTHTGYRRLFYDVQVMQDRGS